MAVSDEFVDYVIDQLAGWGQVSARKMFGGAGLYCDGVRPSIRIPKRQKHT